MDEVNNVDDSMDTTEQSAGGFSRRDMLKASVAAGALVWTAPVLLSGRAAADPADVCCTDGTPVTVKVASTSGVTCQGNSCIDTRAAADPANFKSFSVACDQFVGCLNDPVLDLVVINGFNTQAGTATITIKEGITVVSVGVKTTSTCFFTDCPCLARSATSNTPGTECANTCDTNNCGTPPNRVWITTSGNDTVVNVKNASPLNTVQMTLCLSPEVTGMC